MEKCNFQEKYPIFAEEFLKEDIPVETLDELCCFFLGQIEKHPIAVFLGVFDHFLHTSAIKDGQIDKDIIGAKNIIFCFGKKLLNPKILSVRPRSIGICETKTHYVISFLEAPNPELTETMAGWVRELVRGYARKN
jgi:hypothetical protein